MINELIIESTPPGAFSMISLPMPSTHAPIIIESESLSHQISIEYNPSIVTNGATPKATVHIRTNPTLNSGSEFTFFVTPETSYASLVVDPSLIDFGHVTAGTTATKTVDLQNAGTLPLTIERIAFTGQPGFSATIGGTTYGTAIYASPFALEAPLTLAPGAAEKVDVTFTSDSPDVSQASLWFYGDELSGTSGDLLLLANRGACIRTTPSAITFGPRQVGASYEYGMQIEACGDANLVISSMQIVDDANGVFTVDGGPLPLTVGVGDRVDVHGTYAPKALAQLGPDGQLVPDRGTLRITSNAYQSPLDIPLDGYGTDGNCPVAKITVAEGLEVQPQTVLHLSGLTSTPNIASYKWSVVQPGGSVSTFLPSPNVAEPVFETNIVGEYTFRLEVTDMFGTKSCAPEEVTVVVPSGDAIHVELLWHTPGDLDESDTTTDPLASAGSDLDLHLLRSSSNSAYFDPALDCYFDNPSPAWGIPGPSDDPRLDRNDTDGAGPENLYLSVPEQGQRYRVGVHYKNDWGFGNAFATLRVYIYGVLRDEWPDVDLANLDLWDAYTIDWPSGNVTRIGTTPQITHTGGL